MSARINHKLPWQHWAFQWGDGTVAGIGEHPRTQPYALELTLKFGGISAQGLAVVMMRPRHCGLIPLVIDCLPLTGKGAYLVPISPFTLPIILWARTTSNPWSPSLGLRWPLCLCPALPLLGLSDDIHHCRFLYGRPNLSLGFPTEGTLFMPLSFPLHRFLCVCMSSPMLPFSSLKVYFIAVRTLTRFTLLTKFWVYNKVLLTKDTVMHSWSLELTIHRD